MMQRNIGADHANVKGSAPNCLGVDSPSAAALQETSLNLPDRVEHEFGALSAATARTLTAMGHRLHPLENDYGNMQIVIWDYQNRIVQAASDTRGMGRAGVRH